MANATNAEYYHMHCRYRLYVFAGEFVRLKDGLLVPIGPVHVILERGDRERMSQIVGRVQYYRALGAVVVAGRDDVQLRIDLKVGN